MNQTLQQKGTWLSRKVLSWDYGQLVKRRNISFRSQFGWVFPQEAVLRLTGYGGCLEISLNCPLGFNKILFPDQWFSNFGEYQNHLGNLVNLQKPWCRNPTLRTTALEPSILPWGVSRRKHRGME